MAEFTPRVLTVDGAVLTAYDHGAHVAQWSIADVPIVWVSRRSRYESGVAIRGGVPICWPWFAAGPDGDRKPSHGLARTHVWSLTEQDATSLTWRMNSEDVVGVGDDSYVCEMNVMVSDDSLQLRHTTHNLGEQTLEYEVALHTYLHVGDVRHVAIQGLSGSDYYDKVQGAQGSQTSEPTVTGQVDCIYDSSGPVRVHDPILGRQLTVRSDGAANTVLWNPGPDGAEGMDDFGDEEWTQMLCVESANIGDEAVRLSPGESHTITALITVAQDTGQ